MTLNIGQTWELCQGNGSLDHAGLLAQGGCTDMMHPAVLIKN
jgi:hypothetical protein